MAAITITLDGDQAHCVRRSIASDAENTAKALVSRFQTLKDGKFRSEGVGGSRHERECIDYLTRELDAEIAVLRQLPWSTEDEFNLGLVDNPETVRRTLAEAERREAVEQGAARHGGDEYAFRRDEEHVLRLMVRREVGESNFPESAITALEELTGQTDSGFVTLEDLAVYSRDEIASVEGVGPRSLSAIDAAMELAGLRFAGPVEVVA